MSTIRDYRERIGVCEPTLCLDWCDVGRSIGLAHIYVNEVRIVYNSAMMGAVVCMCRLTEQTTKHGSRLKG